ncbi:MAG: thioredoxin family protein [Candidatus Omnitrophica bacterium]|nr:thioredoxin family protein [Candidatus Omnitrophota bacterium]
MKIEILGMGCPKCKALYENTRQAVREEGIQADIEKVEDMDKITEYGVLMTPGFAVDGQIKSTGKVLTREEIKNLLSPG